MEEMLMEMLAFFRALMIVSFLLLFLFSLSFFKQMHMS